MRAYRIGYTRARLRSLSCLAWIETDSTTDLIGMHDWTHEPSMSSVVSVSAVVIDSRHSRHDDRQDQCRPSILTVSREQTCTTARYGDPSHDVCVGRECWLSGRRSNMPNPNTNPNPNNIYTYTYTRPSMFDGLQK